MILKPNVRDWILRRRKIIVSIYFRECGTRKTHDTCTEVVHFHSSHPFTYTHIHLEAYIIFSCLESFSFPRTCVLIRDFARANVLPFICRKKKEMSKIKQNLEQEFTRASQLTAYLAISYGCSSVWKKKTWTRRTEQATKRSNETMRA